MSSPLHSVALKSVVASAPGRLDFLGGVADYSGSLVLEMPTEVRTTVTLLPEKTDFAHFASPAFGSATLALTPLRALVDLHATPAEIRAHLDTEKFPHWARYPFGCFIILVLHSRIFPESGFRLEIGSAVPDGQGVSSSAALEIATLRAFDEAAGLGLSAIEMARLGQRAENLIVGASCGLMDQLASACGHPGMLLPILCRPDVLHDPLALPEGLAIAGWPTGVKHNVGASPYATARAGAFMGKRLLEHHVKWRWAHTSEIPLDLWKENEEWLPLHMSGKEYITHHADTDDPLTTIDPHHTYPVRAATRFPIEETARAQRARELLFTYSGNPAEAALELRALLKASHDNYSAMGLGSPETDALVDILMAEPIESGLIGGRISGGGSGGTVVVLYEKRAEARFRALAEKQGTPPIIV